jgi:hypothetical protein
MRSLQHEIRIHAEQFGVSDNLVQEVVVDWLVSDAMESPRTPTAYFIPEELAAPTTASGDANPKEVLPSAMRLMAAKRRGEIGSPNEEQTSGLPDDPQRLLPETVG